MRTREFRTLAEKACQDEKLIKAVTKASYQFESKMHAAFDEYPQGDSVKARVAAAKAEVVENMPEMLARFEQELLKHGVQVHWAVDGRQACEIVVALAKEHGVKTVVKGKSMLGEEIGINHALEAAGIVSLETDLGEYIVQLAGETPSHITAPCLHKSKQDISELFAEKLGESSENAEELTYIARRKLRKAFLSAEMGITGANIGIAETGTLVIVENEGNIRMSTTCPPLHVALVGIEKLVPRPENAADILRLLARSGTGQKMSSYVSFLSGPKAENERDGAREMHVVMVDNRRSKILEDPEMREVLQCIRCGSCATMCPVYRALGGHAYAWTYSGPIGTLLATTMYGLDEAGDLVRACTKCGVCAESCPGGIDHPKLFQILRNRMAARACGAEAVALDGYGLALRFPWLYRLGVRLIRLLDPGMKLIQKLPDADAVRRWAKERKLPEFKTPFATLWARMQRDKRKKNNTKGGKHA